MRLTVCFLSTVVALAGILTGPLSLDAADEQVVEVRVKAKESNTDHDSDDDHPAGSGHQDNKAVSTRAVKAFSFFLGKEKKDDGANAKLLIDRGDAAIEIVDVVEKHLKEAGLDEKVIAKVRDALKHHGASKRSYWYFHKADDHEETEDKDYSTPSSTVLHWHSDDAGHYMIGLNSSALEEALQSHLGIDKGGLVVESVMDDSPAELAGLRKHDVIIKADDVLVANQGALVKAVQAAGKDSKELTLSIIRGGKTKSIKVAPTERKAVRLKVKRLPGEKTLAIPNLDVHVVGDANYTAEYPVRVQSVGPAYMYARDVHKSGDAIKGLELQIRELGEQIQILNKSIESLSDRLPED